MVRLILAEIERAEELAKHANIAQAEEASLTNISDTESNEFALVHRTLDDNDELTVRLIVVITAVPATTEVHHLKNIVDALGEDICIREERYDWRQGHKLIACDQWDDALRAKVENIKERSALADRQCDGIRLAQIDDLGMIVWEDDDLTSYCRLVTYSEMADHLTGEKRITLRLPRGLHTRLAREAYESVASSLNSFCIRTLAKAVGYEDLEEFEAQQRKPGRPRNKSVSGSQSGSWSESRSGSRSQDAE